MWGIVPAAGLGSRIQPLAFSKELLPVGCRTDPDGAERPRAVSEYLVERMIRGGADKLCFVIAPGKSDILEYYGAGLPGAAACFVVQPKPAGLCDAIFRPAPFLSSGEPVLIGLPDTVWFPEGALAALPDEGLSFLTFPVERPDLFDAVIADAGGRVHEVQVKAAHPDSSWVWGAVKLGGKVYGELHDLWLERERRDEYLGALVNAYLAIGGEARAFGYGRSYVDVGTLHGYREAIRLLSDPPADLDPESRPRADRTRDYESLQPF